MVSKMLKQIYEFLLVSIGYIQITFVDNTICSFGIQSGHVTLDIKSYDSSI